MSNTKAYEGRAEQVWVEMDEVIGTAFGDVFAMTDLTYGMPSIGGGFVIRGFLMPEIEPDSIATPADTVASETIYVVGASDVSNHSSAFMLV